MEHLLDTEDLDSLYALLRRASKHWRDIGRHLGFTVSELDKITTKTGVSQIDHYFQELLDMWLNRSPPEHQFPFTEDLAKALREVKSHRMAYDLENSKEFMADKRLQAKEAELTQFKETEPSANKGEETATMETATMETATMETATMETEPLAIEGTVPPATKRKETESHSATVVTELPKADSLPATMATELPKADPLPATVATELPKADPLPATVETELPKADPLPATVETELSKADPLPATMETDPLTTVETGLPTNSKAVPLLSTMKPKPSQTEDMKLAVCCTWYRFIVCFSLFILFLSLLITWVT